MTKARKEPLTPYLICHTNEDGTNVAQTKVTAVNQREAFKAFRLAYPQRRIHNWGIEGVEG